jgi:hypothetical protein
VEDVHHGINSRSTKSRPRAKERAPVTAIEDGLTALTQSTNALLTSVNFSKDSLDSDIAAAVAASDSAAQIPLITIATSMVNTQATFINYINGAT